MVLTDALIGTFSYAHDPSLRQNRCFLYHVIGNGTGEWRVPVGGMGAVADELVRAADRAGASLSTGAPVTAIDADDRSGHRSGWPTAQIRSAPTRCWPTAGRPCSTGCSASRPGAAGGQPDQDQHAGPPAAPAALRDSIPRSASPAPCTSARATPGCSRRTRWPPAGRIPDPLPCEVYCHTLTDRSILGDELRRPATTR